MDRLLFLKASPFSISDLKKLEERISNHLFAATEPEGFRLLERRERHLLFQFIQMWTFLEKVENPLGGTLEFKRVGFDICDAFAFAKNPAFVLYNPPKSYRVLLTRIAEFFNFRISIEPITLSIPTWVSIIQQCDPVLKVNGAEMESMKFSKNVEGWVSISGESGVLECLEGLNTKFGGALAGVRLVDDAGTRMIEVSRTGVLKCRGISRDDLVFNLQARIAEARYY